MPQPTKLLTVTAATLSFPKNGNGDVTTEYGSNKTTGSITITYTATTATFAVTAVMASGAAGDYVATSDGHWGVLVSSTTTVVTVDRWRSKGDPNGNSRPVPATGTSVVTIYEGKNIEVGTKAHHILTITFPIQTAAATSAITDMKGTAIYTYTSLGTLTVPMTLDLRDGAGGGLLVEGPFGVKISNANTPTIVTYRDAN